MTAKVEWRLARTQGGIERWEARVGEHDLVAWSDGAWRCSRRFGGVQGKARDLPSAQTAAIRAATGLLVEALAAVPVEDARRFAIAPDRHALARDRSSLRDERGSNLTVVVGDLDPDDLIAIGRLCIAAGVAARGGE